MNILYFISLGFGLAMDAAAVSMCKGLAVGKVKLNHCLIAGAYFGIFQGVMPAIGYVLGSQFEHLIVSVDHWIAFFLLLFIGGNMIKESRESDEEELDDDFGFKTMLMLAIATSIDALAVGITFAFLHVNIIAAVLFIGCITFTCSAIGVTSRLGLKASSTTSNTFIVVNCNYTFFIIRYCTMCTYFYTLLTFFTFIRYYNWFT